MYRRRLPSRYVCPLSRSQGFVLRKKTMCSTFRSCRRLSIFRAFPPVPLSRRWLSSCVSNRRIKSQTASEHMRTLWCIPRIECQNYSCVLGIRLRDIPPIRRKLHGDPPSRPYRARNVIPAFNKTWCIRYCLNILKRSLKYAQSIRTKYVQI